MTVARMDPYRMMTLDEYQNMESEERLELIDGVVYDLAAPSDAHQAAVKEIFGQLYMYLRGKRCQLRGAPYDVYLNENKRCPTIVQPDIMVICDPNKIKKDGCHGAPDMIAEIISPSNQKYDLVTKKRLYRRYGVREYWTVYPEDGFVNVIYFGQDGKEMLETFTHEDMVRVSVLEDCVIDLGLVFPDAKSEEIDKE